MSVFNLLTARPLFDPDAPRCTDTDSISVSLYSFGEMKVNIPGVAYDPSSVRSCWLLKYLCCWKEDVQTCLLLPHSAFMYGSCWGVVLSWMILWERLKIIQWSGFGGRWRNLFFLAVVAPTVNSWIRTLMIRICSGLMVYSGGRLKFCGGSSTAQGRDIKVSPKVLLPFFHILPLAASKRLQNCRNVTGDEHSTGCQEAGL